MDKVDLYESHWGRFRESCEGRAKKADVLINNKGWQKLREFHLKHYLDNMENPFGFLFKIRLRHRDVYIRVKCMPRYYYKYLKLRQIALASPSRDMVQFPTWRRK